MMEHTLPSSSAAYTSGTARYQGLQTGSTDKRVRIVRAVLRKNLTIGGKDAQPSRADLSLS